MPTYTILQRYLYRGNKTWYGRINDGGKISYLSLKTKRKTDAQAWLDQRNAARFIPELAKLEERRHDLGKALFEFIDLKEKVLDGSGTIAIYKTIFNKIRKWSEDNGVKYIEDMNQAIAQDYTNDWAEVLNASTLRQYVMLFRTFFKWAFRKYGIDRNNPFEGVELPKVVKRAKEFWTPEEINLILDQAQTPGLRLEWAFMAFAGFRRHEADNVTADDIKDGNVRVIGKGNKEAFVPVSDRLQAEIERAGGIVHDERKNGKKLELLKEAAEAAGVKGRANPHKFRHSFVSNLLRAGVGDKFVQELARHSQITTTLTVYAHLKQEDLQKAINAIK